ncbi:MAG: InlB B-repeat-containing protein [Clostridia bacterium]|nr:InlB B-repeat-containing protein [Clostridia bacterium]
MKKSIFSLLLALVMLVGMIPATSLPAFAAAADSVWVGGVEMTNDTYLAVGSTTTQTTKPSGGYAYYEDRTLTLNNYSYEGKGYLRNSEDSYYATVYAEQDLTVELVGTNTLKQTASLSEGIRVGVNDSEERLTIQGDGSLNVTSTYCGILAWGLITVNGGTIISTATGGGGYQSSGILSNRDCVIINGGNVTVSGDYGLWVWMPYGSCEINGGTVTATGIDQAIQYFIVAEGMKIQASTTVDGALGEYVAENNDSYKKIVITGKPINNINVSATFSGTPADATTSTTGATVTATKWYKKNGSGWTELGASDTIKEGGSYRCEVTVAATYGCQLANGYTVKINGAAATKKSGNTWYRDVTITGISDYVDVQDIALPEAFTKPDFTYDTSDVAPSRKHWDVAKVEWFECDKDGHILSGALTENYVFQKDTYYRVEVTVVPETNWQFHGSALDFYINGKAAMPLYGYNKAYPNSVTGYVVYHVDDANGTYTVKIGDITLKDGDYLANNATSVTTVKPVGGYACYKDGVLTLNNFVAAKLVRYYERYLEVELIGENKIGAIADYYYWDTTSNNYYTGLEFRGDGDLEFDEYYDDPCCNVSVNGDVFFNGSGDILLDAEFNCFQYTDNVIINDGYVYCYCSQFCVFGDDTNITVNGGKLKMYDGGSWYDYFICDGDLLIYAGSVYVSTDSGKTELADCVPWDGVTDLNTYECVWIVEEQATVTHTVTFKVDTTTVATKTVENGKTVTAPADPTQSGKTFLGWYTAPEGGEKFDFSTPITGDVNLYARFEDAPTVLLGDLDGNGKVNNRDLGLLQVYLNDGDLSNKTFLEEAADLDGNGKINNRDLGLLQKKLNA